MQRMTLIERWAASQGLPLESGGGHLTLVVDREYRIHLSDAPNRKVSIESRICDLPIERHERERLVERAMHISVGRMRMDSAILAVDEVEAALLLQVEAPADGDERGLTEVIGRFIDSLSFWRKVVV